VRQQNLGAVEDFILPYSAVYPRIRKWKNYWNRSTFAKGIVKTKVARFLWPTVYSSVFGLVKNVDQKKNSSSIRHTKPIRVSC